MNDKQVTADLNQIINSHNLPASAEPQTLLQNALIAYQNARTDGLCHEGAWEIALQTLPTQTYLSKNSTTAG